jgi:hypothetical protein
MKILFAKMLLSGLSCKRLLVTTFAILTISLLAGQSSLPRSLPHVEASFHTAAPRTVEELTERSIVRDYTSAWESLDSALSSNSLGVVDAYFVGPAKTDLASAINSQQKSGIRSRYLKQSHKLEAVFYSPEGDVMELLDTAQYDLQLVADGKTIQDEHVVLHYVVLMTPAADRWVIRQLQAVPQF